MKYALFYKEKRLTDWMHPDQAREMLDQVSGCLLNIMIRPRKERFHADQC